MQVTPTDLKILWDLNSDNISNSKAQIRQDIFVLHELQFKSNGFFVDFGATDGLELNNTFLLEKKYKWNGILCEPSKGWHEKLIFNRPNAIIDKRCVWSKSKEKIKFKECEVNTLSTIEEFQNLDNHSNSRKKGNTYLVETVKLTDLLKQHNAPSDIDYLSIDTEGSEYNILKEHDFNQYSFKIITCEHNYTPQRQKIFDLLSSKGYIRKYIRGDWSDFEDWYVRK